MLCVLRKFKDPADVDINPSLFTLESLCLTDPFMRKKGRDVEMGGGKSFLWVLGLNTETSAMKIG